MARRILHLTVSLATFALAACVPTEEGDEGGSTSKVVDGDEPGSGDSGSGDDDGGGSGSGDDGGSEGSSDDGTGGGGDDGSGSGGDDGSDDGGSGDAGDTGDGGDDGGSSTGMDIPLADLDGFTWDLVLAEANITQPPIIGGILTSYFTDSLLYGVIGVGSGTLDMAVAVGAPDGPGYDVGDVLELGAADFSAPPSFEVDGSGTTLQYPYDGIDIPFEDPVFVGEMATDGETLVAIQLSARIDTRDIGALFGLGSSETAVCEFVGSVGVSCTSCSDGEPLCLDLVADWEDAPRIEALSLE